MTLVIHTADKREPEIRERKRNISLSNETINYLNLLIRDEGTFPFDGDHCKLFIQAEGRR